jgi:hypothetical protein
LESFHARFATVPSSSLLRDDLDEELFDPMLLSLSSCITTEAASRFLFNSGFDSDNDEPENDAGARGRIACSRADRVVWFQDEG